MKKKIFYWSPCLNPVGTVISTKNSSVSLTKYSKEYEVFIINACGEWDKFKDEFLKDDVSVIDLGFKYFKYLPKTGYIQSRFSYLVIFVLSFIPLLRLLKKKNANILIAQLITSLPIFIFKLFNFKTDLILRISGMPKLNFIRKKFWEICSSGIKIMTCPSIELKNKIEELKIIENKKIHYLQDAVININEFNRQLKDQNNLNDIFSKNHTVFLSVGRLTRQKNFNYLIKEFHKLYIENKNCRLVILGDGEEYQNLKKLIKKKNLDNVVFLLGRVKNVFKYMKASDAFILSSLWEEMGFVIIESALANLFIISSNCPNGPSEFLNYGKNGILYENNVENALYESLIKFQKLDETKKKNDRLELKKNSIKFTKFRHYNDLNKILKLNN